MASAQSSTPLLLLVLVAGLLLFTLPAVIQSAHAGLHVEAEAIRNCDNIEMIMVNKSCERFNVLKRLDDGRVGDHVVQPCKRGLIEITAYIIGGGSLEEAAKILTSKGCSQVWP